MQKLFNSTLLIVLLFLTGCSIYKIDIQQGNLVSPEMVEKLKPGMTERQVKFVMGNPLLIDPFHPNRWDYLFYKDVNRERVAEQHIVLHFEAGKLSQIEKRKMPAASQPH